jgi:RNA-directed DNA polymerase
MGRVRSRIDDRRILGWVKAFLQAGILTEKGLNRETTTGTPQGGILSPLLANIALSILDDHFTARWLAAGSRTQRSKHRRAGGAIMRLVRYADDFVIMVVGTRDDAEALRAEVSAVLSPMGLRLSEEKTRVCHIDEGFDFLGWRIRRQAWRSRADKKAVYTYPSKKALTAITDKVRSLTHRTKHRTLADLLRRLNPTLRGWCNYFRHGVSSRTFGYVEYFTFWRIFGWLRKRHGQIGKRILVRRGMPDWQISDEGITWFRPQDIAVERYRYRGAQIPTPWSTEGSTSPKV